MNVNELPDFPAMRQLAEALWRSRASVLVGAGFSRNAERGAADSPLPPLWNNLAAEMGKQLYADPKRAPSDALRLADEYRSFFGQAALDDLIRSRIRDAQWSPGAVHKALLELPWSDVLTTNYDTLLERAALEVNGRNYEVVRIESDFSHARAPRIVKLHGTIGVSKHFTITEEDYRTYPIDHAAFVNFARQSFLENELCLLGFSGDDANFLQWSGWVRDHLGASSRRIFLVGLLNLSASRRKYLEGKNIAPIDLAPLVANDENEKRHPKAASIFIDYLRAAKPIPQYDWQPIEENLSGLTQDHFSRRFKDAGFAAELFRKDAGSWSSDRSSYPGWLICPSGIRQRMRSLGHNAPWPNNKSLQGLSVEERAGVLYEFTWRIHTGFGLVNSNVIELLFEIADPGKPCGLTKSEQLQIATILLAWHRDSSEDDKFNYLASLLETHGSDSTEAMASVAYQRALRARDRLNLTDVEVLAPKVVGDDPMWALRRAALLSDIGEIDQAQEIITAALADLRKRQRQDRSSVWIASRRAWAEMLARAVIQNKFQKAERWPQTFRELKCDPWEIMEDVKDVIVKEVKKAREEAVEVRPQFEPGVFKGGNNTVQLGGSGTTPAWEFQRLVEDAGIPVRIGYINILGEMARELMELSNNESLEDWLRLIRFSQSVSDPGFEQYFSRISLAVIPPDHREKIVAALKLEISYWRQKLISSNSARSFANDRLRLLIDILARFAALQSSDEAVYSFLLALDFGRDSHMRHPWLFKSVGKLAEYSIQAVEPSKRASLVLAAMEFPTAGEAGVDHSFEWPSPSRWLQGVSPVRPDGDQQWSARIAKLIELSAAGSVDRSEATFRLSYFVQYQLLTDTELALFSASLWSNLDGGAPPLPVVANIFESAFLWLPAPSGIDVRAALDARLYNTSRENWDEGSVLALAHLASPGRGAEPLAPSGEQAAALFDRFVEWRPKVFDNPMSAAFEGPEQARKAAAIGQAIGKSLAKALSSQERTELRLDALIAFADAVGELGVFEGLPWFAFDLPSRRDSIIEIIKRNLVGSTHSEVNAATLAVLVWSTERKSDFPEIFAERLVAALEVRRVPGLVSILLCLRKLVGGDLLTAQQLARLDGPLGDLLGETAYERIAPLSREAVSNSLVRKECVLLSRTLIAKGVSSSGSQAWLAEASNDPLPEVHFAVEEPLSH